MKRILASVLASGALIPMFWVDVSPNGAAICSSDIPFATVSDRQGDIQGGKYAKVKFCQVVTDFPM